MFKRAFSSITVESTEEKAERLKKVIKEADAIVIGAGSGLSTSAGFTYSGERFDRYFSDFAGKYGIRDMYTGGFYPFPDMETYWAWWSRHIWVNRYMKAPKPVYENLLKIVEGKDCFILTTNVDHQFQMAGFDKKRMFYMQGDYGLLQCSKPCHKKTYDNREMVEQMMLAQGFAKNEDGDMIIPDGVTLKMEVPSDLIPYCPVCGELMTVNLRCDGTFVEDEGWHAASQRYNDFIRRHENLKVVYLELGVGMNTPVWIKYPFWKYTNQNKDATYVCLNYGEAVAPREIQDRSICIDGDIWQVISELYAKVSAM